MEEPAAEVPAGAETLYECALFRVMTSAAYIGNPSDLVPDPVPALGTTFACVNAGKGRVFVIVKCAGMECFPELAGNSVVKGLVMSTFGDGVFALVLKEANKYLRLSAPYELLSLTSGRITDEHLRERFAQFLSTGLHSGNVKFIERLVAPVPSGEIPTFEEFCDIFMRECYDTSKYTAMHANAKRAAVMKSSTPFQVGLLAMHADLKSYIDLQEQAAAMTKLMAEPGPHFVNDFIAQRTLGLRGVVYDPAIGISATTMRAALYEKQSVTRPPLYVDRTIIFVGPSGLGKTEYAIGLAREFCNRRGSDRYVHSGSIDPLGIMTKSGSLKLAGAVILDDFALISRLDTRLNEEEVKQLLYTKQRAHVGARYHQAVLREHVARIWTINSGAPGPDGVPDFGEWFRRERVPCLDRLVYEDNDWFANVATEAEKAIARRCVIFRVTEPLFARGAQGATDNIGLETFINDMRNAFVLPPM